MMNLKEKEEKLIDVFDNPLEFKKTAEHFIEGGYLNTDNDLRDLSDLMVREEMEYFTLKDACDYIVDEGDLGLYLSLYAISENSYANSIKDFLSKENMSLEDCAYKHYGLEIPEDVKELDKKIAVDGIESLNPEELTRYTEEAFRVIGNDINIGIGDTVKMLAGGTLADNVIDGADTPDDLFETIGEWAEELGVEIDTRGRLEKMIDQAKSTLGSENKENISIEEER